MLIFGDGFETLSCEGEGLRRRMIMIILRQFI